MSRTGKIVVVAILAGLMIAVAIVAAVMPAAAPPVRPAPVVRTPDPLADDLARCRTLTMPDAGCEAAWEAHRRRFLGQEPARR
ncbi:MAG TPA: putative entry exclusion protein TrbK-alt [Sphingomonas sp.]|jgi:conjugative transfer region protein TrbK